MTTKIIKDGIGYLDTVVSKLILPTIDIWNNIGATPNTLTTFGLISSILCIYYFYKNDAHNAIIFLILRCYFDYADGMLARKYKKVTKYGDIYDHFVDVSFGIMFYLMIYLKSKKNKFYYIFIITLFNLLFSIHTGCVEIQYSKSNDENSKNKTTIGYLSKLSHGVNPTIMRFFDNTVLYIVMALVIIKICKENLIPDKFPLKGIIMVSRM